MNTSRLSEARAKVQDAESRARLTIDPLAKREWQALADAWRARLRRIEIEQASAVEGNPSEALMDLQ